MRAALQFDPAAAHVSVLDTPEPEYFHKTPLLEGSWASWLVTASSHGQTCSIKSGTVLRPSADDLFIVLGGCVVVTGIDASHSSKPLFVTAMKRGDIIIKPQYSSVDFSFTARNEVHLLHVSGKHYKDFRDAVKNSEAGIMATELTLLALHGVAAHSLLLNETSRLLRVATTLALHPDVPRGRNGTIVSCTKEQLLSYAGVFNRRIGARAFRELEEAGTIVFDGYKKFLYCGEVPA